MARQDQRRRVHFTHDGRPGNDRPGTEFLALVNLGLVPLLLVIEFRFVHDGVSEFRRSVADLLEVRGQCALCPDDRSNHDDLVIFP